MVVVMRLGGSSLRPGSASRGARETMSATWSERWGYRFAASLRRLSSGEVVPIARSTSPVLYPLSHVRVLGAIPAGVHDEVSAASHLAAPYPGASGTL